MPFEIDVGTPPAGYSKKAARRGEIVNPSTRDFFSTEDGQQFIKILEGFPDMILRRAPTPILQSQVDHILAIYRRDGGVTVYVNELQLQPRFRVSKALKSGEAITKDNIADVERLDLDVHLPEDSGIMFVFSIGWRKGIFYDFDPVGIPIFYPRQYDISIVLGQVYCHVLFQERFSISDTEWDSLFTKKWFPFIGLCNDTIDALIAHVRSGWDPDEMLDKIVYEIKGSVSQMMKSWRNKSTLHPHLKILEKAVERFRNNDPMSCTALLFPRIEGILRTHHASRGTVGHLSSKDLVSSAVASKIDNEKCLLLPRRFDKYLNDVYFANFDPNTDNIPVSRHSVGHGVANADNFNWKSAAVSILIVNQLFFL